MAINLKSFDSIAKYVENCGVKSILQTKPVELNKISFGELKVLKNDTFVHANPFYSKMSEIENALLPKELHNTKMGKTFADLAEKIRCLPKEKAFMVDEGGKVIAESKPIGELRFEFSADDMKKLKEIKGNGAKVGYIHNHPLEKTLSADDIILFHQGEFDFAMATTPSGGYSYIQRIKKLDDVIKEDIQNIMNHNMDLNLMQSCEFSVYTKLIKGNKSDKEVVNNLHVFQDEQLKRFVKIHKSMGLKYGYKSGENEAKCFAKLDRTNYFKQDLIEKQGYNEQQVDEVLNLLYKTPVKDFLLS